MAGQAQVDLARISQLENLLGAQLSEIIEALVQSVSEQVEEIERALDAGRPADAVQPAHRCRNDALMIGAKPLLAALTEVESAARRGELEQARSARARLRTIWPATRAELQRAAHEP